MCHVTYVLLSLVIFYVIIFSRNFTPLTPHHQHQMSPTTRHHHNSKFSKFHISKLVESQYNSFFKCFNARFISILCWLLVLMHFNKCAFYNETFYSMAIYFLWLSNIPNAQLSKTHTCVPPIYLFHITIFVSILYFNASTVN